MCPVEQKKRDKRCEMITNHAKTFMILNTLTFLRKTLQSLNFRGKKIVKLKVHN